MNLMKGYVRLFWKNKSDQSIELRSIRTSPLGFSFASSATSQIRARGRRRGRRPRDGGIEIECRTCCVFHLCVCVWMSTCLWVDVETRWIFLLSNRVHGRRGTISSGRPRLKRHSTNISTICDLLCKCTKTRCSHPLYLELLGFPYLSSASCISKHFAMWLGVGSIP